MLVGFIVRSISIHYEIKKGLETRSLEKIYNQLQGITLDVILFIFIYIDICHCVQAYGFAMGRNLEVTDAFQVDPPPIIRIIQIYGTIEKKRAVEYI